MIRGVVQFRSYDNLACLDIFAEAKSSEECVSHARAEMIRLGIDVTKFKFVEFQGVSFPEEKNNAPQVHPGL